MRSHNIVDVLKNTHALTDTHIKISLKHPALLHYNVPYTSLKTTADRQEMLSLIETYSESRDAGTRSDKEE